MNTVLLIAALIPSNERGPEYCTYLAMLASDYAEAYIESDVHAETFIGLAQQSPAFEQEWQQNDVDSAITWVSEANVDGETAEAAVYEECMAWN